ncbi:MAG TPA: hypothetical protein VFV32_11135 [Acidimicrobiales bacterium]|nr:hypothetical protein [Acidimicrobiales bacterium]
MKVEIRVSIVPRLDEQRGDDHHELRTALTATPPEGDELVWEGRTEHGRTLPVPECRQPLSAAKKSSTEQRVVGMRRLAGGAR